MATAFAHPEALWLLALLPVLSGLGWWARRRRRRALFLLGLGPALPRLAGQRGQRFLRGMCLGLGLPLVVLGIAGPQWGREEVPMAAGRDIVVVLDVSRSMLAEQPSRQERAIKALRDLCDTVQKRGGHRLGLVVFAARARVVCPLTHDYDHFRDAVSHQDAANLPPGLRPQSDGPGSGTRIGAALRRAVEIQDPSFAGGQDILFVSDGDDPARDGEWSKGAAAAARSHIPVYTVGVGDPDRSFPIPAGTGFLRHGGDVVQTRLREGPLQEIARRTHGLYIPAQTKNLPLGQWFREVIEPRKTWRQTEEDLLPAYREHFAWFFTPALALLVAGLVIGTGVTWRVLGSVWLVARGSWRVARASLRVPWRVPRAALVLLLVAAAPGPAVDDLLRRGNTAYQQERFEDALAAYTQAERWTTDPALVAFNKGAALFRLERYREAAVCYRRSLDDATGTRRAQALYDLGTCLLRQAGDRDARLLEQAVARYQECRRTVGATPELAEDAAHNLELARLLWIKARARPPDEPPNADPETQKPSPEQQKDNGKAEPGDGAEPDGPPERQQGLGKQGAEQGKGSEHRQPTPGRGNLPTLPDTDELVPLSADDTAAYLEREAQRIRHERREYWQSAAPALPNVKDW
jgi:Ca-activated chloride channel family protein